MIRGIVLIVVMVSIPAITRAGERDEVRRVVDDARSLNRHGKPAAIVVASACGIGVMQGF